MFINDSLSSSAYFKGLIELLAHEIGGKTFVYIGHIGHIVIQKCINFSLKMIPHILPFDAFRLYNDRLTNQLLTIILTQGLSLSYLAILRTVFITGYQYKDVRAKCIKISDHADGGPSSPSVHA